MSKRNSKFGIKVMCAFLIILIGAVLMYFDTKAIHEDKFFTEQFSVKQVDAIRTIANGSVVELGCIVVGLYLLVSLLFDISSNRKGKEETK